MAGNGPYPFPTPAVDPIDKVLFNGVTGAYQKTITITNNSPTQWVYAFLEGQNSRQAVAPYAGTGAFDPYDPSNHEYRGYVGYTDGTNQYAGLPPLTAITITVPLVFWDSGRIVFSTDGADQFATHGGVESGSQVGAPFYYLETNTQAVYYGNIDASQPDRLCFTPIYNGFDPANGGMPTTKDWKSPVASGIFRDGQSFIVTGPGLPSDGYQVTVDADHPLYVDLPGKVATSQAAQQYVFQALPGEDISPTTRHIQNGFPLQARGGPETTDGLVMWYHALTSQSPNNDAPYQLTEVSFRGTFYDPKINAGTGFQYLLGPDVIEGARTDSLDYDLSFVDTINMPIALEARDVSIPNTDLQAPFGWVGSSQGLERFQQAVAAFTSTNPAGGGNANFLGSYFDGKGYPSYLAIDPANLKLPSGQNLFLASPAIGGAADIQYYRHFSDGSVIKEPLYALTSGGSGPVTLSIGGDPSHPSRGHYLGLNTTALANAYALNQIIAPNLAAGQVYQVNYIEGNTTVPVGNAVGMYYAEDGKTIIGVELDGDVPAGAGTLVFNFNLPTADYATARIAGLWYSWAKYYADHVQWSPLIDASGTISAGNILTLDSPTAGLVPGMAVAGAGVPAGCIVLSIAGDRRTIQLSAKVGGNPTSFTFAAPTFESIVGFDEDHPGNTPLVDLSFSGAQRAYALAFAQAVYVVMRAWSVSVPPGASNGWNPLLANIIGGNLDSDYLPDANTDVVNTLTDMSKSVLRGVPDFTNPLYSNPAQWYPDPALPAGGQTYNAFNLDPFVWFIHRKLGLTAYAFSLDDDIGNVNAGGATHLDVGVGGLDGLINKDPYTNVSPWGVVTTGAADASAKSSVIASLANPEVVYQVAPFDYNAMTPGTLVNGPGVPMGTTAQFTQIAPVLSRSRIVLSNPLAGSSDGSTYAFFGPLSFTGTVLGAGQADDTILLDSVDAYNTLLKLGPLKNVRVTGEGIDPAQTVTIEGLSRDATTGVITLRLGGSLDPSLVSQPGGFYAYTFGSPAAGLVRDPGWEWADVQGLGGDFNHGGQLSQNTVDWTFVDSPTRPQDWFAGIALGEGSVYTAKNPPPPQGLQVGFIQGDSRISQTVTVGGGTYSLSVYAARSAAFPSAQSLDVLVDGALVGAIAPQGTTYQKSTIRFSAAPGKHTITLKGTQASDGTILFDAMTLGPAPPLTTPPSRLALQAIPDQSVNEGEDLRFSASATGAASTLTYTLGPDAPAGATIDPQTGVFTWAPALPGKYTVTIRASDASSPSLVAIQTVSITVHNLAPVVTLTPDIGIGQTADFRGTGSFADRTAGSFLATVDYGDGSGPQPLPLDPSGMFVLAHAYTQSGAFTITVSVRDAFGGVGTASLTLTVDAAPLVSGFGGGRDAFVAALYREALGRPPEPDALRSWSRRLARGIDPKLVARFLWGSPELRASMHGGPTSPATFRRWFVTALLHRRRAVRLHLPPPEDPLMLRVRPADGDLPGT